MRSSVCSEWMLPQPLPRPHHRKLPQQPPRPRAISALLHRPPRRLHQPFHLRPHPSRRLCTAVKFRQTSNSKLPMTSAFHSYPKMKSPPSLPPSTVRSRRPRRTWHICCSRCQDTAPPSSAIRRAVLFGRQCMKEVGSSPHVYPSSFGNLPPVKETQCDSGLTRQVFPPAPFLDPFDALNIRSNSPVSAFQSPRGSARQAPW